MCPDCNRAHQQRDRATAREIRAVQDWCDAVEMAAELRRRLDTGDIEGVRRGLRFLGVSRQTRKRLSREVNG